MLSRVANGLYWMSRYVERAENTARLVDVNLQLMLDSSKLDDTALAGYWNPILQSTGDHEAFARQYNRADGRSVTEFLVFETGNPNSIVSSISQARENARTVRDQVTVELWEELNRLYLFLGAGRARELWRQSPFEFFQEIKNSSLLLQGLTDATVVRNEGWYFTQVGRYIERADKTSRLIDVRHDSLSTSQPTTQEAALGWAAVLRSCSAWDAYKAQYGPQIEPRQVIDILLLSEDFPRSVRFCVQQLNTSLRRISGVAEGRFCNDAERLCGRILAELQFGTTGEFIGRGLHDCIDDLQAKLNAIGDALFQAYIHQHFALQQEDEIRQQEEQQQQTLQEKNPPGAAG